MMTKDQLTARLQREIMPLQRIAKACGLAPNTVVNIKNGKGARYDTIVRLSRYFSERERQKSSDE